MLLTEREAREKWCLLTNTGTMEDPHCATSACMAWRWGEEEGELSYDHTGKLVDGGPKGATRRGYCGLAGPVQFT